MAQTSINATPLKLTRRLQHTPQISSFFATATTANPPTFRAGQVAILALGEHKPTYMAFASAPHEPEFEFLIKRNPFTEAFFAETTPAQLMLQDVVGSGFPVETYQDHDLIFIAMGTGLAPLRSALRHILQNRAAYGRLIVLYGTRSLEDFCYQDEMQNQWAAQGVELRQVLSQPDAAWSGPTGYVQSLLDNLIPELNNPVALVCGSPEMMTQTKERLTALGFAAEKILTNY